jgi:hypothetical protein
MRQIFSRQRQIFIERQSSMGMKLAILAEREKAQKRSTIPAVPRPRHIQRMSARAKDYTRK